MDSGFNYWLAQLLILVFYIMTLLIYNRARSEYIGGKIGAAINLIMLFLLVLFLSDVVDYFFQMFLPIGEDTILIIKIVLRLVAICVLFFGGLRFFIGKSRGPGVIRQTVELRDETPAKGEPVVEPESHMGATVALEKDERAALPKLGRYEILEQIGRGAWGLFIRGGILYSTD